MDACSTLPLLLGCEATAVENSLVGFAVATMEPAVLCTGDDDGRSSARALPLQAIILTGPTLQADDELANSNNEKAVLILPRTGLAEQGPLGAIAERRGGSVDELE